MSTLQTDHKLPKHLFSPDKKIPESTSAGITKWLIVDLGIRLHKMSSNEKTETKNCAQSKERLRTTERCLETP